MTPQQYQLWLAVWNAGIKAGLQSSQALQQADEAAQALDESTYYGA